MTTQEYVKKTERQLIQSFLKTFYARVGYYPTVITRSNNDDGSSLKLLDLNELENYFTPYLPTLYGKKVELSSKLRIREIIELRQMFCYIARNIGYSLKTIGVFLGNRDHTTVIHNLKAFNNMAETDGHFREKYNNIVKKIKEDGYYNNASVMVGTDKV